jgi:serine/threonine protein phosphatase PrpC/CRP-like cAMP-binding protein
MRIESAAYTHAGRVRPHNEDAFRDERDHGVFIVCDGMGGHAAGEVASSMACDAFMHALAPTPLRDTAPDPTEPESHQAILRTRHAVEAASKQVFDEAARNVERRGMGTTLVALVLLGGKGLVTHVGDSRLYLVRDGQVHRLTTDHNFRTEVVRAGIMSSEEAARSPHAHIITRAVGVAATVSADVLAFDVLPGDTFVLCTDGLHEYLDESGSDLLGFTTDRSLEQAAQGLGELALARGGHDNITALVVRVLGQTDRERTRKHTVNRALEALRDLDMFRDLDMAELVRVYGLLTTEHVQAGQCILREGESTSGLYIMLDGAVEVARGGAAIATLGRGTHFGEMSLLNQRPRTATVIAVSKATLLRLEIGQFQQLLAHEPGIASKVLLKLAQTLSLRLDDAYLARDQRYGRPTLGLGEYPAPTPPRKR